MDLVIEDGKISRLVSTASKFRNKRAIFKVDKIIVIILAIIFAVYILIPLVFGSFDISNNSNKAVNSINTTVNNTNNASITTGRNINSDKRIDIYLEYSNSSIEFNNGTGTASTKGLISMTINKTKFNWDVNYSQLCSRWKVYSVDRGISTIICHGNKICCNYLYLDPIQELWNDEFKLYFDRFGATNYNIVNAQVIYIKQDILNNNSTLSDIEILSKWEGIPARFEDYSIKDSSSKNNQGISNQNISLVNINNSYFRNNNPENYSNAINNSFIGVEVSNNKLNLTKSGIQIDNKDNDLIVNGDKNDNKDDNKNKVTGFSISIWDYSITIDYYKSLYAIAIIIFLFSIYVFFTLRSNHHISLLVHPVARKIEDLTVEGNLHSDMENYAEAKRIYKEITDLFSLLEAKERSLVYNKIVNLYQRIEVLYLNQKIKEIKEAIKNKRYKDAKVLYKQVCNGYKGLDRASKRLVLRECNELHYFLKSENIK